MMEWTKVIISIFSTLFIGSGAFFTIHHFVLDPRVAKMQPASIDIRSSILYVVYFISMFTGFIMIGTLPFLMIPGRIDVSRVLESLILGGCLIGVAFFILFFEIDTAVLFFQKNNSIYHVTKVDKSTILYEEILPFSKDGKIKGTQKLNNIDSFIFSGPNSLITERKIVSISSITLRKKVNKNHEHIFDIVKEKFALQDKENQQHVVSEKNKYMSPETKMKIFDQNIHQLRQLKELQLEGIITNQEFELLKKKILNI